MCNAGAVNTQYRNAAIKTTKPVGFVPNDMSLLCGSYIKVVSLFTGVKKGYCIFF